MLAGGRTLARRESREDLAFYALVCPEHIVYVFSPKAVRRLAKIGRKELGDVGIPHLDECEYATLAVAELFAQLFDMRVYHVLVDLEASGLGRQIQETPAKLSGWEDAINSRP